MNKEAITNIDLLKVIKKRWSPRAFSERPVEKEKLIEIFEAARWSASGYNEQPWRFIVGIKGTGTTWQKIYNSLMEANQLWCYRTPVLVLLIGKKTFSHDNSVNHWYQYDVGQAAAYISMQAIKNELYAHQLGGLNTKEAAKSFDIPDDYEVFTAMAIGYLDSPDVLADNLKEMELKSRTRKKLDEIVFSDKWNSKSEILFS